MTNDTFIREVNEELRQDRIKALWTRFGVIIAVVAVVAVIATIAYVVWDRHRASVAAAAGDAFLTATEQAEGGDTPGAIAALESLAAEGVGAYPDLARLRIGSLQATAGDMAAAVASFDAVANSSAAPQPLRDVAAVRAGYILVDTGSVEDVRQRVERLTGDANALRAPAREALGLATWKAGDLDSASGFFGEIVQDFAAPDGIAERAGILQELIDAEVPFAPGVVPADTGSLPADGAPTDAPAAPEAAAPSPTPAPEPAPAPAPAELAPSATPAPSGAALPPS